MAEQPAALADEGDAAFDAAPRLAREQHMQPHAVDIVGDAETIRPDQGKPGRAGDNRDGLLCLAVADLGKTRGENQRRTDLAARASLDRLAHGTCGKCEHGNVDALGQFLRAFQDAPAGDRLGAAADQMDVARESVELEGLKDDLARAAGALRNADDCHRAGPQESCDRLWPTGCLGAAHTAARSGWNMRRWVPSSSRCQ